MLKRTVKTVLIRYAFQRWSRSRCAGVKRNFWPLRNFYLIFVVSYFISRSKGIKLGVYFLMCVA